MLLDAESGTGDEVLRVWRWPRQAVVLGAGGVLSDDVDEAQCLADAILIARRASGGGTVLLGPGCLLFSLVLDVNAAPELSHIGSSYRYILERIARSLVDVQPGIEFAGTSDLSVGGRKFSGNAQQRKRRFILHHGSLLHAFDLTMVERYLKLPPRRPEYRGTRPHAEFLMNLPDQPDELVARLRHAWQADTDTAKWPEERVRELVAEKYNRADWVRRR